jgi:hypothetical protein
MITPALEILEAAMDLLVPLGLAANLACVWIWWRRHQRMLTLPHLLERLCVDAAMRRRLPVFWAYEQAFGKRIRVDVVLEDEGEVEATADNPPWYLNPD